MSIAISGASSSLKDFASLTPPYMMMVGFYTVYTSFLMHAPLPSVDYSDSTQYCVSGWWQNLLYINNFWPKEKQVSLLLL